MGIVGQAQTVFCFLLEVDFKILRPPPKKKNLVWFAVFLTVASGQA